MATRFLLGLITARSVRILLECILVLCVNHADASLKKFMRSLHLKHEQDRNYCHLSNIYGKFERLSGLLGEKVTVSV